MIKFTDDTLSRLNQRQARAIQNLLHYTCQDEYAGTNPETVIAYEVEVKQTSYGTAWVSIKSDIPSLPPGNALRVCYQIESWHVHVGKRGKLEAASYPRALKQFAGQVWCGIHIEDFERKQKTYQRRAAKEIK